MKRINCYITRNGLPLCSYAMKFSLDANGMPHYCGHRSIRLAKRSLKALRRTYPDKEFAIVRGVCPNDSEVQS